MGQLDAARRQLMDRVRAMHATLRAKWAECDALDAALKTAAAEQALPAPFVLVERSRLRSTSAAMQALLRKRAAS